MRYLFVLFLLVPSLLQAQAKLIDSLERDIHTLQGSTKAEALFRLASYYQRTDKQKLLQSATEARKLLAHGDALTRAYAWLAVGIDQYSRGVMDSAVHTFEAAKEMSGRLKNKPAIIRSCQTLGRALTMSGKPQKGLENLFEGLQLLGASPDAEFEYKIRVNIILGYLELKQSRQCIDFALESLPLMSKPEFEYIQLFAYNNLAVCYGMLGLLDSAKHMVEKGMEAAKHTNDLQSLANSYFILGTIYSNAGQYDLAIEQYEAAKPYREKSGNLLFIVADLYTMADLYHKTGNYQEGIRTANQALSLARKNNLLMKFEDSYLSLAKNYEGLKDYKNASKYYNLWALAKDTIYSQSHTQAIAEMQTKYETEKKEQYITLQNAQLFQQRIQLQRTYVVLAALLIIVALVVIILLLVRSRYKRKHELAESEKELAVREAFIDATMRSQENERKRFAQDLHDGMGQLISSLRLMINQINVNTPTEDRVAVVARSENILNDMHTEIRSIAFNLMPQTLIQHGLVPALKEMTIRINETGKVIASVSEFNIPSRLKEVHEISIYRIIQEWINNVIKYAEAEKIEVQLVGHADEISITIEDDGNGFDPTELEIGDGNGWRNIQSRTNLVKGQVEVDSKRGYRGTTLILRFPITAMNAVESNKGVDTQ